MYIGSGYDIFRGNPKSNFIDPGFRAQIFNLKYTQDLKTENLEFKIPDFTTSKTRSSCSYYSDFKQYTGTKEYQKDLRAYVGFSVSNSFFFDASFTSSLEYKNMKKTTSQSSTVFFESSTDCEVFSLEMPSFDLISS